jgi:LysM domain
LTRSSKICPICGTPAHTNATVCSTCGTTLVNVSAQELGTNSLPKTQQYTRDYGETDLSETELHEKGRNILFAAIAIIGVVALIALVFVLSPYLSPAEPNLQQLTSSPSQSAILPVASDIPLALSTNTARPSPILITVTPAPPTLSPTPTPGPCVRVVQSGDSLISLAGSCGHRDLAVLDVILQENDLAAPEALQVGQEIIIPWPSPIVDVNALSPTAEEASTSVSQVTSPQPSNVADPQIASVPTLQAGVAWHRIISGETIVSISFTYGANAEILSQLNPELNFSQCDFSLDTGGPRCNVILVEGQQIRVPAPTQTPTIRPTLSGSETPTPSPTPTFNAPTSLSPSDRALFARESLVTLRWVTSGMLSQSQAYRVNVHDLTINVRLSADTTDLFFVIPREWQGADARRHEFEWSVSVISLNDPTNPTFTTEVRTFLWESREEN